MDLTITIVIQGLAFFAVAWLVMKFGWPHIIGAMEERQKKIAEGLAAANRGQKDLDEAKAKAQEIIREARDKAVQIVDQANKRGNEIVEDAKNSATSEGQRLLSQARESIALESTRAREGLRREVGSLAVSGASRLLGREIDSRTHADLLDKLAAEIAGG
ncbi:MAG: F0F1 ATP synthase subunit B [Proteobacteria bacterium]|nr:F0F1 ATP synthase subunit B [Pseudomonadota bacterium]